MRKKDSPSSIFRLIYNWCGGELVSNKKCSITSLIRVINCCFDKISGCWRSICGALLSSSAIFVVIDGFPFFKIKFRAYKLFRWCPTNKTRWPRPWNVLLLGLTGIFFVYFRCTLFISQFNWHHNSIVSKLGILVFRWWADTDRCRNCMQFWF